MRRHAFVTALILGMIALTLAATLAQGPRQSESTPSEDTPNESCSYLDPDDPIRLRCPQWIMGTNSAGENVYYAQEWMHCTTLGCYDGPFAAMMEGDFPNAPATCPIDCDSAYVVLQNGPPDSKFLGYPGRRKPIGFNPIVEPFESGGLGRPPRMEAWDKVQRDNAELRAIFVTFKRPETNETIYAKLMNVIVPTHMVRPEKHIPHTRIFRLGYEVQPSNGQSFEEEFIARPYNSLPGGGPATIYQVHPVLSTTNFNWHPELTYVVMLAADRTN